jgi:hypothetical protein
MTPTNGLFSLTFPMKTWSALAAHVTEAFRPSLGHIALPVHQAKRSRSNRKQNIGITAAPL